MNAPITYIDAGSWSEFLQYQKDHPNENCIYIADEVFLREKKPGLIKRIGTFENRWNYVAISEMIERAEERWQDFFEDIKVKEDIQQKGLTDKDMEYGV